MQWIGRPVRVAVSAFVSLALTGCGVGSTIEKTVVGSPPALGTATPVPTFFGAVAGDDPQAVTIGQRVLAQNGSAADAAVAMGFTMAVTLPSRAALGGGGACLAYAPSVDTVDHGVPVAILFTSRATSIKAGDRPAAVPMLAQGLFALHARYGVLPIEQDIVPAEQLARLGSVVSRPFAQDLAVVGDALLADPVASSVFGAQGAVLGEGDLMIQRDLATTLARLRVIGADDLTRGAIAKLLVAQSPAAGGPLSATDLAQALPLRATPLTVPAGRYQVSFLPPPADGGVGSAAAFEALEVSAKDLKLPEARALGAVSASRAGMPAGTILLKPQITASTLGALPASTSFVALDRTGGAVACALTMGNLFGTGRVVPQTGILLAASPAVMAPPLLSAAVAWSRSNHAFRAEVAGSGQHLAAFGVAYGMFRALIGKVAMPATVPGPGRINAIGCTAGLPGDAEQCSWATDPRGDGLALGNQPPQ